MNSVDSYLELNLSAGLYNINTLNFFQSKEAFCVFHPVRHGNFFPIQVLDSDGTLIVTATIDIGGLLALIRLGRGGFGIASSLLTHNELSNLGVLRSEENAEVTSHRERKKAAEKV